MSEYSEEFEEGFSVAGQLLGAHPGLLDPNFIGSVILVSAHMPSEGALGVIINRPMNKVLSDLKPEVEGDVLRNLPVYAGGPVSRNELLLAAWKWEAAQQNFRLYFGVDPEKLASLLKEDPTLEGRAFLGYSGWSAGQLEHELERSDWVVGPFMHQFGKTSPGSLWKTFMKEHRPDLGNLIEFPDDPSLN